MDPNDPRRGQYVQGYGAPSYNHGQHQQAQQQPPPQQGHPSYPYNTHSAPMVVPGIVARSHHPQQQHPQQLQPASTHGAWVNPSHHPHPQQPAVMTSTPFQQPVIHRPSAPATTATYHTVAAAPMNPMMTSPPSVPVASQPLAQHPPPSTTAAPVPQSFTFAQVTSSMPHAVASSSSTTTGPPRPYPTSSHGGALPSPAASIASSGAATPTSLASAPQVTSRPPLTVPYPTPGTTNPSPAVPMAPPGPPSPSKPSQQQQQQVPPSWQAATLRPPVPGAPVATAPINRPHFVPPPTPPEAPLTIKPGSRYLDYGSKPATVQPSLSSAIKRFRVEECWPLVMGGGEVMVPIKINVEVGGVRLVESMVVDALDELVTPEVLASQICADLDLNRDFERLVSQSIRKQVAAYLHFSQASLPPTPEEADGSHLFPVVLEIRHGSFVYKDTIEWDIFSSHNSPEVFARLTVADLGLPPEFEAVIASTIHEQVVNYRELMRGQAHQLLDPQMVKKGGDEGKGGEAPPSTMVRRVQPPALTSLIRADDEVELWSPRFTQPDFSSKMRGAVDVLRMSRPGGNDGAPHHT